MQVTYLIFLAPEQEPELELESVPETAQRLAGFRFMALAINQRQEHRLGAPRPAAPVRASLEPHNLCHPPRRVHRREHSIFEIGCENVEIADSWNMTLVSGLPRNIPPEYWPIIISAESKSQQEQVGKEQGAGNLSATNPFYFSSCTRFLAYWQDPCLPDIW